MQKSLWPKASLDYYLLKYHISLFLGTYLHLRAYKNFNGYENLSDENVIVCAWGSEYRWAPSLALTFTVFVFVYLFTCKHKYQRIHAQAGFCGCCIGSQLPGWYSSQGSTSFKGGLYYAKYFVLNCYDVIMSFLYQRYTQTVLNHSCMFEKSLSHLELHKHLLVYNALPICTKLLPKAQFPAELSCSRAFYNNWTYLVLV